MMKINETSFWVLNNGEILENKDAEIFLSYKRKSFIKLRKEVIASTKVMIEQLRELEINELNDFNCIMELGEAMSMFEINMLELLKNMNETLEEE